MHDENVTKKTLELFLSWRQLRAQVFRRIEYAARLTS